jgi:hypothetical protein
MDRMDPVHIRPSTDHMGTICGQSGGSVTLRHVQERPEQIAVLRMCEACMAGCRGPMAAVAFS